MILAKFDQLRKTLPSRLPCRGLFVKDELIPAKNVFETYMCEDKIYRVYRTESHVCAFFIHEVSAITHIWQILPFYAPWKHQKTKG